MNMRFPLSDGTAPRACATPCARKNKEKNFFRKVVFVSKRNLVRYFILLQFFHSLKKHLIDLVLFCLGRLSIPTFSLRRCKLLTCPKTSKGRQDKTFALFLKKLSTVCEWFLDFIFYHNFKCSYIVFVLVARRSANDRWQMAEGSVEFCAGLH